MAAAAGGVRPTLLAALVATAIAGIPASAETADVANASRTVVVIGGGIGGGSFAYYHSLSRPQDNIVVLERNSRAGGRLLHTRVLNQASVSSRADKDKQMLVNQNALVHVTMMELANKTKNIIEREKAAHEQEKGALQAQVQAGLEMTSKFISENSSLRDILRSLQSTLPILSESLIQQSASLQECQALVRQLSNDPFIVRESAAHTIDVLTTISLLSDALSNASARVQDGATRLHAGMVAADRVALEFVD